MCVPYKVRRVSVRSLYCKTLNIALLIVYFITGGLRVVAHNFSQCCCYCCDRKSPSGMCAKLRTAAASNTRVHMPWSLYYCLFAPHMWFCSSYTSLSWWIAHSTQRQPKSCNTMKWTLLFLLGRKQNDRSKRSKNPKKTIVTPWRKKLPTASPGWRRNSAIYRSVKKTCRTDGKRH